MTFPDPCGVQDHFLQKDQNPLQKEHQKIPTKKSILWRKGRASIILVSGPKGPKKPGWD